MSFFESIMTALFCMVVVFVVLSVLCIFIKFQTFIIKKIEAAIKRTE
jgi:Na+-transporting methylmalonyl-CoA/oxaloacetate decarboxylase gamma subunit